MSDDFQAEVEAPRTVRVLLSRANSAYIYDIPEEWAPMQGFPETQHWARQYGTPVAHQLNEIWFDGDGWTRVYPQEKLEELLAILPDYIFHS